MLLRKLGKYDIIEWLGGGHFGDVFLAKDTLLDKDFALKISRMRKEEIAILKDEAKLLASLNHPHIVRFYNIDFIEGKFVLVMEFIRGKTLRDIITDEGIDIDDTVSIVAQVLDGVSYAHEHGVLHRDIKPENILLAQRDVRSEVKITDFGLARFIKTGSLSASTAGTPIYMAPEVWSGSFTEKSDIWSIGALIYEMLTGVPPFLSDDLSSLSTKISKGNFLLPTMLKTSIPEYIEDAIVKSLAVDPLCRPDAIDLLAIITRKHRGVKVKGYVTTPKKEVSAIELTPTQSDVIDNVDGKILLLGQAGCGKTTTLIYAICRLLQRGVPASNILVSTFTNKGCRDIWERLKQLSVYPQSDLWIGTFHTIGLRLLRRDIERLDMSEHFTIQDSRQVIQQLKIKPGKYRSKAIARFIESLKAQGIMPQHFKPDNDWEKLGHSVYKAYQQYMKENNILDYDDLILYAVQLLEEHDDIREFYHYRFQYVFVDELQDINHAQYQLITLLTRHNLLVTGDEDQAIYGWRGADRRLMNDFVKKNKDIKTFYLTRSFRLPQGILELANNLLLRETTAVPIAEPGEVFVYAAKSEKDEAHYVSKEIRQLKKDGFRFQDIVVLYRMNYLSHTYEEAFIKSRTPHTLVGGTSFYEQAEVKSIIEYLELLDRQAQKKTLAPKDVEEFNAHAGALFKVSEKNLKRFSTLLNYHLENRAILTPAHVIAEITGVSSMKGENVDELIARARSYAHISLAEFLNEIRLIQELDLVDWGKDTVKLMTVHSAKGLEFPVVFVVDLVEDIFPLTKKMASDKEIEEERRLCYVAATRAQRKLYLVYPKWRHGRVQQPSRFLVDMFKTGAL